MTSRWRGVVSMLVVGAVAVVVAGTFATRGPSAGDGRVWTKHGYEGPGSDSAAVAARTAMVEWGRLMALPRDLRERARVVADPATAARQRRVLAAHFDPVEAFDRRLDSSVDSVVADEQYAAYAGYDIVDVSVVWSSGADGFVVFEGRRRYRMHDGTSELQPREQFQVWLRALAPGDWRVTRFETVELGPHG